MQHANWIAQARTHWAEHQPKKFKRLLKAGTLDKALSEAATATSESMRALTTQGATQEEAWEATRELYLFPAEEPQQTPRMRKSHGYLAHVDLMRGLANLGMPEEEEVAED